jgi:hypothetical protein
MISNDQPVRPLSALLSAQYGDDSRTTVGAPTARMKTCDMIGQPQILHCLRSEKGLALGPVAVALDRDFEHPKKIFAGRCSIFCSKPDQTVDGGLARMTKVFMSDYYLR